MSDAQDHRDREKRATMRRTLGGSLPIRSYPLGQEPVLAPESLGSPDERLAQLAVLSRRAYQLSGCPLPSYTRQTIPVRVIRGSAHEQ